jgi:hypothetical protein
MQCQYEICAIHAVRLISIITREHSETVYASAS